MDRMDLDVLLVAPGTELAARGTWNREPPLGLLYLAAILERDGFSCQIIEVDVQQDDRGAIEDALSSLPVPAVVGFTTLTNTSRRVGEAMVTTREFYRDERHADPAVLVGGPHATFAHDAMLHEGVVDACVLGEAEGTIGTIAGHAISAGTATACKRSWMQEMPRLNLAFKTGNGEIVRGDPAAGQVGDLDAIPFPARHLAPANRPGHVYDVATVLLNRGCPNQCIFCSRQALFKPPRVRSPWSIVKELESIHDAGTFRHCNLYDNLTVSRTFAMDLLDAIAGNHRIGLPWGAELRADLVDDRMAVALARAGCTLAAVGIESADDAILRGAGKFQSIAKVTAGLARLKANGIRVQAYFVVGLPGETRGTFERTIEYIESGVLVPGEDTIDLFAATPYPGSALLERRDELGVEILDGNLDHYDCQHLTCRPASIGLEELETIWAEAKAFEARFNGATVQP